MDNARQYRISPIYQGMVRKWRLQVTYGLLDTADIGVYAKQAEAREKAKAHAKRNGWKPIILT